MMCIYALVATGSIVTYKTNANVTEVVSINVTEVTTIHVMEAAAKTDATEISSAATSGCWVVGYYLEAHC